jgi:toxin-antitoxin system PIN domain toxin
VSYTVDANVLLYASDESSPLHGAARAVVERLARGPDIAYLFWPTVMAYLRIATHPAIFDRPLSGTEAIRNVEQLLNRPHVQVPGEQDGFWDRYREVARDARPSGNLVPDAHLVALMVENGVRTIWTHDRDFRRFAGIEVHDPFADVGETSG